MLLLKRHLIDLVRQGLKRQTIRLWSRPMLRVNQISHTPGLGKMKITAIDKLPSLAALTEQDAHADGFTSLAQLLAEIHRIYGPTPPADRHVYRIKFTWPITPPRTHHTSPRKSPPRKPASPKLHRTPPSNQKSKPKPQKSKTSARLRELLRSYIVEQKALISGRGKSRHASTPFEKEPP